MKRAKIIGSLEEMLKKFDYYYALGVGRFLNGVEWVTKSIVPTHSKGVESKLNISYGSSKNQRMDIFYSQAPIKSEEKKPIFFYIHGGGFVSGITALRRSYCCKMAKEGFFVVNIDYTVAPKVHFKDSFKDIFNAIDFVLDKSEEYNLDEEKIVIGGESAGAYFSAYIAAMTKQKQLYEQFNVDFQRINSFNVQSVVLINGAFSADIFKAKVPFTKTFVKAFFDLQNSDLKNPEIIHRKEFSPLNYIKNDFPKTIVVQGKYDVFGLGTKSLLEVLDREQVDYDLLVAKGIAGCHAVSIIPISKNANEVQTQTARILKEHLN